mmetsp:Transcript_51636/g.82014  ORF Transcript_51636/g.82014 Transcript_51636/m.82014 type:complete len:276 (+) Transcript_51636:50-877(+)
MSPFKLAFKKVHHVSSPCCGTRSKNEGAEARAHSKCSASSSQKIQVGLASVFGKRSPRHYTRFDSTSSTSTCSTSLSEGTPCHGDLTKQSDIDGHLFEASFSDLSVGSSVWSTMQAGEEVELYDQAKCCSTSQPEGSPCHNDARLFHTDFVDRIYPTGAYSFLLDTALTNHSDIDAHVLAPPYLPIATSVRSGVQAGAECELCDEAKLLEDLQASVSHCHQDVIQKEREVKELEKEMQLEMFRRTKQQAQRGDCFAIVYCAIFKLWSIAPNSSHD